MSMQKAVAGYSVKPQGLVLGVCKQCKAVCVKVDKRRSLCNKCRLGK